MAKHDDDEVVWGADAIAKLIGLNPRQTYHLLNKGELPFAKKVGGKYAATRGGARAYFRGEAA